MLFRLELGEKILYKGGFANTWRADPLCLFFNLNNLTSSLFYITNKRIVSKRFLLFQGISIPLDKIESMEKPKQNDFPGKGLAITYQKDGKKKKTEIIFIITPLGAQKRRDGFYNKLKELLPSKVKKDR